MTTLRAAAIVSIIFVSACTFGKSGEEWPVALRPGGAPVTIVSTGRHFTGELVMVRDNGLVVIANKRLLLFPFASIDVMTATGMGRAFSLSAGEKLSSEKRERLRLISQFPQGMTAEIERRLLAELNQTEITTIEE